MPRLFLQRTSKLSHRLPGPRSDYTKKLGAGAAPAKREAQAGDVTAPGKLDSSFALPTGRRLASSVLLAADLWVEKGVANERFHREIEKGETLLL